MADIIFKGTYNCLHRRFDGTYEPLHVPCEILAETSKTYKIRLLAPNVNGHRHGDVIRVQRRMVSGAPMEARVDCTEEWWQD